MIKRIIRVIMYAILIPKIFVSFLIAPFIGVFCLLSYIVTGKNYDDLIFKLADYSIELPEIIFKRLKI